MPDIFETSNQTVVSGLLQLLPARLADTALTLSPACVKVPESGLPSDALWQPRNSPWS